MVRTVIFDLDGLLIDSECITYRLYQELLRGYGHSFPLDQYVKTYSGKTAVGNMKALINTYLLPISVNEGLHWVSSKENEYFQQGVALKPGAKELITFLKQNGITTVLASSSTRERALSALTQHELANAFDAMVFGTEVEKGKPNPDIFLKACEKADSRPEYCLVLEDSEAGIMAAYNAHIPVLCVPDLKKPAPKVQQLTEGVFGSLLDVKDYLERTHFIKETTSINTDLP